MYTNTHIGISIGHCGESDLSIYFYSLYGFFKSSHVGVVFLLGYDSGEVPGITKSTTYFV